MRLFDRLIKHFANGWSLPVCIPQVDPMRLLYRLIKHLLAAVQGVSEPNALALQAYQASC